MNTGALIALDMSIMLQLAATVVACLLDPYIAKEHRRLMVIADGLLLCLIIQNNIVFFLEREDSASFLLTAVRIVGAALSAAALILFIRIAVTESGDRSSRKLLLFYGCLVLVCAAADLFFPDLGNPIPFFTVAIVSIALLYYIRLHMQFVREHEKAMLVQQRIQIMMSQIQPHFLYNTLSTIQALCMIDPGKAAEVTEKFGTYLRQNLNTLDKADLIPLDKELEHTRIYADIEMIRFPSISVTYDIADRNFELPALTIQPMVENAIRHGVRGRKKGQVTVSTRLGSDRHVITIQDNGKGFDTNNLEQSTGKGHIGIRNVRERIRELCNGTVEVDSRLDEGTVITISIPFTTGGKN